MSQIHYFDSLASTNQYCELLDLNKEEEFACYCARTQTAGIGQRGNHWEAEPRKNLTFSLILHPHSIAIQDQFRITQILSLGIADWLEEQIENQPVSIKWPNDIYVGNRKICGILIALKLKGNAIETAIAGIGLNINQTQFSDWIPNPTSLQILTKREYNLDECLPSLIEAIRKRYSEAADSLNEDYLHHLYLRGKKSRFWHQERPIEATITGIDSKGRLLLSSENGESIIADLKELRYNIDNKTI